MLRIVARPRVPLTTFEREKLRSARIWSLIVGALGIGVAALALGAGQEQTSLLVLLVAATFVGGVWSVALRVPWLTALLLSAAAVATGVLAGYPIIGATAGLALFGWLAFQSGVPPSLTPESLRALDPDAVDPEAVPAVEAFEALGYRRTGAYGFEPVPGKSVVATVLVGPRRIGTQSSPTSSSTSSARSASACSSPGTRRRHRCRRTGSATTCAAPHPPSSRTDIAAPSSSSRLAA
jgi:hypothetical protein